MENGQRSCNCPPDLILSGDGKTCISPPTCSIDQFPCHSGKVNCIPIVWKCDGTPDCGDKSDEMVCPECPETQFRCSRGKCLDRTRLCDGKLDCPDGSDEQCCGLDEFRCLKGNTCLNMLQVCDAKEDCPDRSDENSKSCRFKMDRMPLEMSTNTTKSYAFVSVVSLVVLVCVVFVAYRCKRKGTFEDTEFTTNDILMGATRPLNVQIPDRRANSFSSKEHSLNRRGISSTSIQQSSEPLYDRNMGASSSNSSTHNYPKETANPPPSPVTDLSQFDSSSYSSQAHSRSSRGAILPFHNKRKWPRSRNPPPTPCSTDIYDSEPSPFKYVYYDNSHADLNYDSDPRPPPPTPRSHYFSDGSPPPSPGTERSFFNPYPPPPSPVADGET